MFVKYCMHAARSSLARARISENCIRTSIKIKDTRMHRTLKHTMSYSIDIIIQNYRIKGLAVHTGDSGYVYFLLCNHLLLWFPVLCVTASSITYVCVAMLCAYQHQKLISQCSVRSCCSVVLQPVALHAVNVSWCMLLIRK